MLEWIRKIFGYSETANVTNVTDVSDDTKERINVLEKKTEVLIQANLDLTNSLAEVLEVADSEAIDKIKNLREKRNSDLRVINANFELINEKIKNSLQSTEKKYDGILEVIAEKMTEKDVPIDLMSGDISLRKILKRKNQSEGALLATVYLLKKYFDDKGIRV